MYSHEQEAKIKYSTSTNNMLTSMSTTHTNESTSKRDSEISNENGYSPESLIKDDNIVTDSVLEFYSFIKNIHTVMKFKMIKELEVYKKKIKDHHLFLSGLQLILDIEREIEVKREIITLEMIPKLIEDNNILLKENNKIPQYIIQSIMSKLENTMNDDETYSVSTAILENYDIDFNQFESELVDEKQQKTLWDAFMKLVNHILDLSHDDSSEVVTQEILLEIEALFQTNATFDRQNFLLHNYINEKNYQAIKQSIAILKQHVKPSNQTNNVSSENTIEISIVEDSDQSENIQSPRMGHS